MNVQIIGFNYTKVSAEKKGDFREVKNPKDRKISANIEFEDVKKEKVVLLGEDVLRISFNFSIAYEPKIANLNFNGFILAKTDKDTLKKAIKDWKKKKLPQEMNIPLSNLVLTRCTLRAFQLEEELGLPTHINLPKITKK